MLSDSATFPPTFPTLARFTFAQPQLPRYVLTLLSCSALLAPRLCHIDDETPRRPLFLVSGWQWRIPVKNLRTETRRLRGDPGRTFLSSPLPCTTLAFLLRPTSPDSNQQSDYHHRYHRYEFEPLRSYVKLAGVSRGRRCWSLVDHRGTNGGWRDRHASRDDLRTTAGHRNHQIFRSQGQSANKPPQYLQPNCVARQRPRRAAGLPLRAQQPQVKAEFG